MARAFTDDDLRGRRLVWLLDLEWDGRVVRLAGDRVTAPLGDDGEDLEYAPGLVWERAADVGMDVGGGTLPGLSATLTLYLYPEIDVTAMIADGHDLAAATGRLRLWAEGTDHAITVIDGVIRGATWDTPDAPITCTIEELPVTDTGQLPSMDYRATLDNWSDRDSAIRGEFYPIVIGSPNSATGSTSKATPGLLVDVTAGTVLLAGHRTVAGLNGDDVRLLNVTQNNSAYLPAAHDTDATGRPVTCIDTSGMASPPVEGDELWIRWRSSGGAWTYGLIGDDGSTPRRGAGEVIEWALRQSSIRWDQGAAAAARAVLDGYKIDTYIMPPRRQPAAPLHWLQDAIFPMLPISVSMGPAGLTIIPWDYQARASDAVVDLVEGAGGNCDAIGRIEYTERDDIASTVVVEYAPDPRGGDMQADVILSGDATTLTAEPDAVRDLWLTQAAVAYGVTRSVTIRAAAVHDDITAAAIATWAARLHGPPRMTAVYEVDQYPGGLLRPGSVVTITDATRGFDARAAMVYHTEWTEVGRVQVEIQIPSYQPGEAT